MAITEEAAGNAKAAAECRAVINAFRKIREQHCDKFTKFYNIIEERVKAEEEERIIIINLENYEISDKEIQKLYFECGFLIDPALRENIRGRLHGISEKIRGNLTSETYKQLLKEIEGIEEQNRLAEKITFADKMFSEYGFVINVDKPELSTFGGLSSVEILDNLVTQGDEARIREFKKVIKRMVKAAQYYEAFNDLIVICKLENCLESVLTKIVDSYMDVYLKLSSAKKQLFWFPEGSAWWKVIMELDESIRNEIIGQRKLGDILEYEIKLDEFNEQLSRGFVMMSADDEIRRWVDDDGTPGELKTYNGMHLTGVFTQDDWNRCEEFKNIVEKLKAVALKKDIEGDQAGAAECLVFASWIGKHIEIIVKNRDTVINTRDSCNDAISIIRKLLLFFSNEEMRGIVEQEVDVLEECFKKMLANTISTPPMKNFELYRRSLYAMTRCLGAALLAQGAAVEEPEAYLK